MASERSEITMDQRLRFFALDDAHIRRFPRIAAALRRYVPAALNRLYDRIGANPALSSLFGGPSRIDHARNAQLARDRAKAVRAALIGQGARPEQTRLKSPASVLGGDELREARRVDVAIVAQGGTAPTKP